MRKWFTLSMILALPHMLLAQKKYDDVLKKQLDSVMLEDQRYRGFLAQLDTETRDSLTWTYDLAFASMLDDSLMTLQRKIDSGNYIFVERIIKTKGYPGKSMVGSPSNEVAWYVLQHSKNITKYFSLIKEAAKKGEIADSLLTKMEKRLLDEKLKETTHRAPRIGDEDVIKEKVKNASKFIWPEAELPTSTFKYFSLAESFAQKNDSAGASECFLKVSPYYLMYLGQTPKVLKFFLAKFRLIKPLKDEYAELFRKVYDAPKPDIYKRLESMYMETKNLIRLLDSVPMNMKAKAERKIHIADSIHFEFLFKYVQKNGWPDIESGSLYAGSIALRDIKHCYDYLPILYGAFTKGYLPAKTIQTALFNKRYYPDYVNIQQFLKGRWKQFDVSAALDGIMPSDAKDIIEFVRSACPIKDVILVLESPRKIYKGKVIGSFHSNKFEHFDEHWGDLLSGIASVCGLSQGPTMFKTTYWQPYDREAERLTMYVLF